MFLRIKRRKLATRGKSKYSFRVMLVKSVREEGKPRQKIVLYLGSIRDDALRNFALRRNFTQRIFERVEHWTFTPTEAAALKVKIVQLLSHTAHQLT